MSEKVTVLFIGGFGRSGSTLLDRVLAQIPGFFSVGELRHIWDEGVQANYPCGCGRNFHRCEFWSAVGEEAFGGFHKLNVERIRTLKHAVDRLRYIPMLTLSQMSISDFCPRRTEQLQEYGLLLEKLYRGIQSVSGAKVIVDSSKYPSYAFLLSTLPCIDLRLAHLVRDSRAVAYSWSKRKMKPEIEGHETFLPQYGPLQSSLEWGAHGYLLRLLSRLIQYSSLLRYEDFVSNPDLQIRRILYELELDSTHDLSFIERRNILLAVNHTVSGNPMRFRVGDIELRLDDEWRVKMPDRDKYTVTTLTWPLLMKYGYLGGERVS